MQIALRIFKSIYDIYGPFMEAEQFIGLTLSFR